MYADKKRGWQDEVWKKAHHGRRLSVVDAEWYRRRSVDMHEEADRLWEEANEESRKAGHPHKGRDGEEVAYEQPRLGTFEQSRKTLVELIEKGEVTWPPRP